jgi:hypothetical protein
MSSRFRLLAHVSSGQATETLDGVRGDGLCSLWAVLIGVCMRFGEHNLHFNQELVSERKTQPKKIAHILEMLKSFCMFILACQDQYMLDDFNASLDVSLKFQPWEIEYLITQLKNANISTLQGDTHFKMLCILLQISIHVYSTKDKTEFKFGMHERVIHIQTDGSHYSLLANQSEVEDYDFTSYWWQEQWQGHPLNTGNTCIYLPTLTK